MNKPRYALLVAALCLASAGLGAFVSSGPGTASAAARDDLEARLTRVEDKLAIRRILMEYGKRLDNRNLAGYADLFAEDGEWIGGLGRAQGPEAIHQMLKESDLGPGLEEPPETLSNFHIMTNAIIDVNGDTATALSKYLFVMEGQDGTPRPYIAGRYRDTFVKVNGDWKFKKRVTQADMLPDGPLSIDGSEDQ